MSSQPRIQENVSLAGMNSLGIDAQARYFVSVTSVDALRQALAWGAEQSVEPLILGGGSNLVFAGDYPGLVIRLAISRRCWENIDGDEATLVLGAGENWHSVVIYAASAGYRGIENLALIPGTVGAAPVQNIGAYGSELRDTLLEVSALDRRTGEEITLTNSLCHFSYRDSVFKHEPGRYVITTVRLRLSRSRPFSLEYRDLADYFDGEDTRSLTPLEVANAVMAVRRRKLPDPAQLPNAGSFFKNPVVSLKTWHALQQSYPDIAGHPGDNNAKVAAAWLIDQCGWKGYRNGKVGVHNRQALVLVNHSHGSGQDVLALADRIRNDVEARFGIALEMEPGVVGRP
ncbi:UDP-N-acetylenolpyruvoylglucosamine reductase [Marinobacter vulgaris]|uniref:UDP-N-acetylenolpyruvoylglucosamine reductase n=1 Tax=Marinobacter vulgaris TaxID=1928331 RepID=A0A2V3ZIS0_9GAMM|nr:UDP-N-acetylmuramate dehydrogenase [Marinobacter vulgaris]PXX90832.1 UDP-N-acetylenolpyruvoylglucosamine reductase [Marinobacter vulgaris]TSJ70191.1 UDP-N-acetylmuramate dehydrogenase [Marinobacter vulgaris]